MNVILNVVLVNFGYVYCFIFNGIGCKEVRCWWCIVFNYKFIWCNIFSVIRNCECLVVIIFNSNVKFCYGI